MVTTKNRKYDCKKQVTEKSMVPPLQAMSSKQHVSFSLSMCSANGDTAVLQLSHRYKVKHFDHDASIKVTGKLWKICMFLINIITQIICVILNAWLDKRWCISINMTMKSLERDCVVYYWQFEYLFKGVSMLSSMINIVGPLCRESIDDRRYLSPPPPKGQ